MRDSWEEGGSFQLLKEIGAFLPVRGVWQMREGATTPMIERKAHLALNATTFEVHALSQGDLLFLTEFWTDIRTRASQSELLIIDKLTEALYSRNEGTVSRAAGSARATVILSS